MRPVYNGYEEVFMTGIEIKDYFKDAYLCFGKHHSQISSYKINFDKNYRKIENNKRYRLFINKYFCKIMDIDTDESLYFFGYTNDKPAWAKD